MVKDEKSTWWETIKDAPSNIATWAFGEKYWEQDTLFKNFDDDTWQFETEKQDYEEGTGVIKKTLNLPKKFVAEHQSLITGTAGITAAASSIAACSFTGVLLYNMLFNKQKQILNNSQVQQKDLLQIKQFLAQMAKQQAMKK